MTQLKETKFNIKIFPNGRNRQKALSLIGHSVYNIYICACIYKKQKKTDAMKLTVYACMYMTACMYV